MPPPLPLYKQTKNLNINQISFHFICSHFLGVHIFVKKPAQQIPSSCFHIARWHPGHLPKKNRLRIQRIAPRSWNPWHEVGCEMGWNWYLILVKEGLVYSSQYSVVIRVDSFLIKGWGWSSKPICTPMIRFEVCMNWVHCCEDACYYNSLN